MACKDCRKANRTGARYCSQCGDRLASGVLSEASEVSRGEKRASDASLDDLQSGISTQLSECPVDRIDEAVSDVLGQVGEFLAADGVGLRLSNEAGDSLVLTHRWLSSSSKPSFAIGHSLSSSEAPWLYRQMKKGQTVFVESLADIPSEAERERGLFQLEGSTSSLLVPVGSADSVRGCLYLQIRREGACFASDIESALISIGQFIVAALERKRMRAEPEPTVTRHVRMLSGRGDLADELEHRLAFERLAAEVAARFISVPVDQIDVAIEDALGRLGDFLEIESVTVRLLDETGSALVLTHRWRKQGAHFKYDLGHELLVEHVPWLHTRLLADEVVQVSRLSEIPVEARGERMIFSHMGQASSMAVPLNKSTGLIGMQYFTMRSKRKIWPQEDESLLRFLAGSIANALQRKEAEQSLKQTIENRTRALASSLERLERTNMVLKRARAARDRFLATMSHELRTPMNAVLGYADMLAGRYYGDLNEKQEQYLSAISTSGNHLLGLLDNLLEVSRLDSGKVELDLEPISFEDLLATPVATLSGEADRQGVRVVLESVKEMPTVMCDAVRIGQVLVNLLNNALKYTEKGGNVVLRGLRQGAFARIEVSDSGIGITEDHQESIFTEFEQVDRRRDEALGGIGMGLPLSKRLVELHGGQIGLESTAGEGATFWFTVPIAEHVPVAAARTGRDAVDAPSPVNAGGPFILVAEDNQTNLLMVLDMLEALGYRTLGVSDGKAAVEAVRANPPDLILMDVRMPVMDGLEATRRIVALPDRAEIPVVALTANAGAEHQKESAAAGCQGFLSKPIRMAALDAELKRLIRSGAGS